MSRMRQRSRVLFENRRSFSFISRSCGGISSRSLLRFLAEAVDLPEDVDVTEPGPLLCGTEFVEPGLRPRFAGCCGIGPAFEGSEGKSVCGSGVVAPEDEIGEPTDSGDLTEFQISGVKPW